MTRFRRLDVSGAEMMAAEGLRRHKSDFDLLYLLPGVRQVTGRGFGTAGRTAGSSSQLRPGARVKTTLPGRATDAEQRPRKEAAGGHS